MSLQDGNALTYDIGGGSSITLTVLPGTVSINGTPTKKIEQTGGFQTYLTSDASGIRNHRLYDPTLSLPGLGTRAVTETFNPPRILAGGDMTLGQAVASNGTVTFLVSGVGSYDLAYSATATLEAIETVTVPYGTFTAIRLFTTLTITGLVAGTPYDDSQTQTLWVADHVGMVKMQEPGDPPISLTSTNVTPPALALASAVLPGSRAVAVGSTATAFATILAAGSGTATGCSIAPLVALPGASFLYQTTDPATNALTGSASTPADIAAGGSQSFLIAFTPTQALAPTTVPLYFDCANTGPAALLPGVNDLKLAALSTPGPDVIALSATPSADGILSIPGPPGAAAFAVAAANVGAAGTITAAADTGAAVLPLTLALCRTDALGACTNPAIPGPQVVIDVDPGETLTFSVFATAAGAVPLDAAANRITVRFTAAGVESGSTSVAVSTVP